MIPTQLDVLAGVLFILRFSHSCLTDIQLILTSGNDTLD